MRIGTNTCVVHHYGSAATAQQQQILLLPSPDQLDSDVQNSVCVSLTSLRTMGNRGDRESQPDLSDAPFIGKGSGRAESFNTRKMTSTVAESTCPGQVITHNTDLELC